MFDRSTRIWRGWWLGVVSLIGCTAHIGEGQFQCQPDDPSSCPAGFACQVRGDVLEYRCYQDATAGFCGDGVLGPGEVCEGSYQGAETCREHGHWAGSLGCSQYCRPDDSG